MKVKVLPFQTLADIAIRHTGSVDNLYDIALANAITLDQDLVPGSLLMIPDNLPADRTVVRLYNDSRLNPASAATTDSLPGGLDYRGIQIDFIVS